MAEGKALIVSGVEEELDPMLDPVLNKQWIQKGKSKYINLMDKLCEFQETFALYLITRLPNPHFSPEDQAKCVVVDFTVLTQRDFQPFPNFNFASMASTRCHTAVTPSTWPSERRRVSRAHGDGFATRSFDAGGASRSA